MSVPQSKIDDTMFFHYDKEFKKLKNHMEAP